MLQTERSSLGNAEFAGGKILCSLNVNGNRHEAGMSLEELVSGGRIEDGLAVAQRSKTPDCDEWIYGEIKRYEERKKLLTWIDRFD